jgi:hypothetical protein
MPEDVTLSDQPTTELGQTGAMLVAELADAYEAQAAAMARIDTARKALELLMGDAHVATVDGLTVATWKPQVSRRFDQATAKRFLTPDQLEACLVPVETRPFRRAS